MDYISKPALMGKLTSGDMQQKIKAMSGADAYNEFLTMVNGTEKADVAPVRRGFRRRTGEIYACEGLVEVKCSECEETNLFDVIRYETSARYCPYCGAKWKRGADNGK